MQELITALQAIDRFFKEDAAELIGGTALNFYKESWEHHAYKGRTVQRWPQRQPGAGRNRGRGLLTDTGHLRNSMRMQVRGQTIIISNSRPYAQIHNEGGKVAVTDRMRRYFWAMHMQTAKRDSKGKLRDTHWKYMAMAKTITIPQRQFMDIEGRGMSPFLERRIGRALDREVERILSRYR